MWVILGLLTLLLVVAVGTIVLSARSLVWRPAIRLLAAAKAQIELGKRSLATISTHNAHPGMGSETNDRRSLDLNHTTDPRH